MTKNDFVHFTIIDDATGLFWEYGRTLVQVYFDGDQTETIRNGAVSVFKSLGRS